MKRKMCANYDVFPKIVPADATTVIRIRPRFRHLAFPAENKIAVSVCGVSGLHTDGSYCKAARACTDPAHSELESFRLLPDGTLEITARFLGEQEHNITLDLTEPGYRGGDSWALRSHEKLRFNVYSLREDLFKLRPWRGDFHMHSFYSDGREAPAYVAARNRELGMDFIAVTDHHRYAPSLEAMEFWKDQPVDLKIFPGEEVHLPDNNVHIINFGGSHSINALARENEERYRAEVAVIEAELKKVFGDGDHFMTAASEWAFDRIREAGGVAVFCHPCWQTDVYEINTAVTDEVFRRRKFDAFELLGGFYPDQWQSNNEQLAWCCEEWARGGRFPVVGLSDAHGTEKDSETEALAGWYSTIVFSESVDFPVLGDAIRRGDCVAVQKVGLNGLPGIYGTHRLVRYAAFLWENYFPVHDEFCVEEGQLMREFLGGGIASEPARKALAALSGRTAAYREACFA